MNKDLLFNSSRNETFIQINNIIELNCLDSCNSGLFDYAYGAFFALLGLAWIVIDEYFSWDWLSSMSLVLAKIVSDYTVSIPTAKFLYNSQPKKAPEK